MQEINLTAIYIANIMAIVLVCIMFADGRGHIIHDPIENKCVTIMILTAITACVVDTLSFTFDGTPGIVGWFFAYMGNGILFCLNMVIGPVWSMLVIYHVRGVYYKYEKYMVCILCITGFILLVLNNFYPMIYHVDTNNVYHRDGLYWYYLAMEVFLLIYGSVVYLVAKSRGGILKFFPLIHFIVPIIIGLAVQTKFYGVSTIPPFMTVSICCMINSLQNERIYRDSLTGLYNRAYLDYLNRESFKKSGVITAVMIDLNSFKEINDKFGHGIGDEALINIAEILRNETGDIGSAIRYAGDEFVVLLNTDNDEIVSDFIARITAKTKEFNEVQKKKYKLSFALGYYSVDLNQKTVDELMNEVDRRMYENKEAYYINNPQHNRRK